MGQGASSMGAMANILGLGGPEARSSALSDWWDSSGGDFMLNQGLDQVDAMYRSRGLAQSGAAMKGMEDYRSGLASSKMGEGMGYMSDLARLGLGAGGLVSSAGQYGKGSGSESSDGFGKFVGGALASIFSDPDLKTDVVKTGSLGTYLYRYKDDPTGKLYHGLMADEVEEKLPQAAGPRIKGYRTIDLMKLAEAQG